MGTVHPGWGCGCVCWVGEDQDRKAAREKGKERDRQRQRQRDPERKRGGESEAAQPRAESTCVQGLCLGGGGGQDPLHLRAPGEGVSWLVHLEAARPESWLFHVPLT